jgi:transcription initiation factor TFIIF subunit beta
MEEATRKTRVMQDVKGPQRVVPLPMRANLIQRLDGKDPAAKQKFERMEKAPLEDKLMGLFERRNLWSFKQLVEETKQPAMWLKEVLQEIATLNRRGPNAGQYSLKEMYRKRGGAV